MARWVFVEADAAPESAFEEARRAEEPAWPGPAATVVAADLEAPDAGERIERVAGLPLVRGIRQLLQDLPGERLAAPALRRGSPRSRVRVSSSTRVCAGPGSTAWTARWAMSTRTSRSSTVSARRRWTRVWARTPGGPGGRACGVRPVMSGWW